MAFNILSIEAVEEVFNRFSCDNNIIINVEDLQLAILLLVGIDISEDNIIKIYKMIEQSGNYNENEINCNYKTFCLIITTLRENYINSNSLLEELFTSIQKEYNIESIFYQQYKMLIENYCKTEEIDENKIIQSFIYLKDSQSNRITNESLSLKVTI